ncbi:MAG: L,D-transpeptidase family protein [Pseudomonadota bacterium]
MPVNKRQFVVSRRPGRRTQGLVRLGSRMLACALGRSGPVAIKREGDGGTPGGRLGLGAVLYRADRLGRPRTKLPVRAIRPGDGWCDEPRDRNYNRRVTLPYPASAEQLWREDRLYDVVVVLDYNIRPRARGIGSAIFLHLARDGLDPTEGCVALRLADLLRLLASARPGDALVVRR